VDSERFAAAAASTTTAAAARAPWRDRFGRYVVTVGGIELRKGSLELLEAVGVFRDAATYAARRGAAAAHLDLYAKLAATSTKEARL
jgi:hypothetical protein